MSLLQRRGEKLEKRVSKAATYFETFFIKKKVLERDVNEKAVRVVRFGP